MRAVAFILLLLVVAGIVVAVLFLQRPQVPQSVTYVTNEADKRKKAGISTPYGGFDFAW